jgi:hypothetical protein
LVNFSSGAAILAADVEMRAPLHCLDFKPQAQIEITLILPVITVRGTAAPAISKMVLQASASKKKSVRKNRLALAFRTSPTATRVPGNVALESFVSWKTEIAKGCAPLATLALPQAQIPTYLALLARSVRNAAFANLRVAVIASVLVFQN